MDAGKIQLQEVFLITLSFNNSKEATSSNSKLVGPSDYQDGDDGVKLEPRSDPA